MRKSSQRLVINPLGSKRLISSRYLRELEKAPLAAELKAVLGGPVGTILALIAGISARAVLTRVQDRRFVAQRLLAGNDEQVRLGAKFAAA